MSAQDKTRSYRDVLVGEKGIVLAEAAHELTSRFPSGEKYGLISQMTCAALSVPSNLAEGQARRTTGDFVRYVSNAKGSIAELDTQRVIAERLKYCTIAAVGALSQRSLELRKLLNSLQQEFSPGG